jgi:hypothetical protein
MMIVALPPGNGCYRILMSSPVLSAWWSSPGSDDGSRRTFVICQLCDWMQLWAERRGGVSERTTSLFLCNLLLWRLCLCEIHRFSLRCKFGFYEIYLSRFSLLPDLYMCQMRVITLCLIERRSGPVRAHPSPTWRWSYTDERSAPVLTCVKWLSETALQQRHKSIYTKIMGAGLIIRPKSCDGVRALKGDEYHPSLDICNHHTEVVDCHSADKSKQLRMNDWHCLTGAR